MVKTDFPIKEETRIALIEKIIDISVKFGNPISPEEISFVEFKEEHYSLDVVVLKDGSSKQHIGYAIEDDIKAGTQRISPDIHEYVMKYLLQKIWRQVRRECLEIENYMIDRGDHEKAKMHAHDDATINTKWNYEIIKKYPEIQTGFGKMDCEIRLDTKIESNNINVEINYDSIEFEMNVPESILLEKMIPLKQIISMPHCGNDEIQQIFENQYVHCISRSGKKTGNNIFLRTGSMKYPMSKSKDIYPWRDLRSLRVFVTATSYDPKTYDEMADIEKYKRMVKDFFCKHGTPQQWYSKVA